MSWHGMGAGEQFHEHGTGGAFAAVDGVREANMRRLLLVLAAMTAGCDDSIPGLCKTTSDCPPGIECVDGLCLRPLNRDGGDNTPDASTDAPDSGAPDGGGGPKDGGVDAGSPAPGGKWEAATCGSAYGEKTMANSRNRAVGSLSEATPGGEGGAIEMKNSSHRCIGGFNAALRSK